MLMRFDPFRELDRLGELAATTQAPRAFPMDAYRRGDRFYVELDMPGVETGSIDMTVEKNVLTINALTSASRRSTTCWVNASSSSTNWALSSEGTAVSPLASVSRSGRRRDSAAEACPRASSATRRL